ncbi:hypothetical protein AGR9A_Cc210487 [Agrobacterium salinitolerans str. Hayward 0363]|nr:hypothetical protein AGR9A_Cc210487 [Agrobacterium salinitolerans str. Hayward 0363]
MDSERITCACSTSGRKQNDHTADQHPLGRLLKSLLGYAHYSSCAARLGMNNISRMFLMV